MDRLYDGALTRCALELQRLIDKATAIDRQVRLPNAPAFVARFLLKKTTWGPVSGGETAGTLEITRHR